MLELVQTLGQLLGLLGQFIVALLALALQYALLLFWVAWALVAIDWKKLWPTLSEGAWAPFTLLGVLAALVWSQLVPAPDGYLGLPNFWGQLLAVALFFGLTLF